MPATMTITVGAQVAGANMSQQKIIQGSSVLLLNVTVPAAKAGTLTTRTDADTASLTMAAGHAITTGATVDVYWSGGSRRSMTVGTVSGNTVPVDGGSGDALPIATTALTVSVQVSHPFNFVGNNVLGMSFVTGSKGTFIIAGSDNIEDYARVLGDSGAAVWFSGNGDTNPVAGQTETQVFLSNGGSVESTMQVAIILV